VVNLFVGRARHSKRLTLARTLATDTLAREKMAKQEIAVFPSKMQKAFELAANKRGCDLSYLSWREETA